MTEPVTLEGKGLTVEYWLTAKGDKQYRVKATDPDAKVVDQLCADANEILKRRADIEVK